MDGNGRWAAQRHLPRVEGHRAGIDAVRDTVETGARLGIDVLTLYAFSVENWKRPASEVGTLMGLLKRYLRSELNMLLDNNIRFQVIGRMEELAPDIQDELHRAMERTSANSRPAVQHRVELRRPHGDPRCRQAAIADGAPAAGPHRRDVSRIAALHRRSARSRSADSHQRRDARQQFPALADRVRRDLRDRNALAGLPAPSSARSRSRVPEARTPLRRHHLDLRRSSARNDPRAQRRSSWPRARWRPSCFCRRSACEHSSPMRRGAAAFEYLALVGVDDSRGRGAYVVLVGIIAWQLSSNGQPRHRCRR